MMKGRQAGKPFVRPSLLPLKYVGAYRLEGGKAVCRNTVVSPALFFPMVQNLK